MDPLRPHTRLFLKLTQLQVQQVITTVPQLRLEALLLRKMTTTTSTKPISTQQQLHRLRRRQRRSLQQVFQVSLVHASPILASTMENALSQQILNIPGWHTIAFVRQRRLFLPEEIVNTARAIQIRASTAEHAKLQKRESRNMKISNALVRMDLLEITANCN